jgi:hypothetical protein
MAIPANTPSPAWIGVEYAERRTDPVVVGPDGTESSRIEEGCNVVLASAAPTSGVAIACLVLERNAWRLDTSFVPSRPR